MPLSLNPSFLIEVVDDEVLVCDPDGKQVALLSGAHGTLVKALLDNKDPGVVDPAVVGDLTAMGVVTEGLALASRRTFVGLGIAAASAGVMTIAMPTPAAAASGCSFSLVESQWEQSGGEISLCHFIGENTCDYTHFKILVEFDTGDTEEKRYEIADFANFTPANFDNFPGDPDTENFEDYPVASITLYGTNADGSPVSPGIVLTEL